MRREADGLGAAGAGNFPKTPKWKFVFVCHVTTNPFFTPTQYGAEDACALLGASFQWTGSKDAIVAEMVNATNTAMTGKADGIALASWTSRPSKIRSTKRWTQASPSSPSMPTVRDDRAPTAWPTSGRASTSRGSPWDSERWQSRLR